MKAQDQTREEVNKKLALMIRTGRRGIGPGRFTACETLQLVDNRDFFAGSRLFRALF